MQVPDQLQKNIETNQETKPLQKKYLTITTCGVHTATTGERNQHICATYRTEHVSQYSSHVCTHAQPFMQQFVT